MGSYGLIFGPSKSGKTILGENLALSFAAGLPECLGLPIGTPPQKVLFISLEEFWQYRTERNKRQIEFIRGTGKEGFENNYLVVTENFPRHVHDNKGWEILRKTILESESKIIIVDSLTRLNAGQIEDSSVSEAMSLKLRGLSSTLGTTMVVIHHSRKQYGEAITIDTLAGSRVLSQEADFLIGINKVAKGIRYYKEVAFRYKQENDESVIPF